MKNKYAEYFAEECKNNADRMASDEALYQKTIGWICLTLKYKYTYNNIYNNERKAYWAIFSG